MARADLKAALRALQGGVGFNKYVNTLESSKADIIAQLIHKGTDPARWGELIAEVRVYHDLLSDIKQNT